MPGSILGNRVIRKEDPKFLTSGGKYLDDLNDLPELAGAAHIAYVRSATAHGAITSIDTAAKTFVLREVTVSYAGSGIEYRGGSAALLAAGAKVEVKGELAADGKTLNAKRISFGD